ncbi:MAG: response regulator [Verrucomicrobia bacterium]|nr:response regulator [Verrucomicrobiota bacterium]
MTRTIIPDLWNGRTKGLRAGENAILEMIALGAPLSDVLDRLMRLSEARFEGLLASILLLDPEGKRLRHAAAPSLPADYMRAIDGTPIGPSVGSCGTAAYRKEMVIVTDIQTDPLWAPFKYLAEPHGLRACWSTPIVSRRGKVLGTFAMYYREVRSPSRAELRLLKGTTHLAGIAIEKAQLEERLRQVQKMEAFGQLAGGIAHDFNNVLTAIKGNVSLLQTAKLSDSERTAITYEISDAADRAASLTRQLLSFSRRRLMQPQALDLNKVVAEVVKMLRRLIGEHIILETRYAQDALPVFADASMLEQVLVNLAVNSRDAMSDGGRLTLVTSRVRVGRSEAVRSRNRRPGQYARLSVSDTGAGIAAEHLPRIFEPFFTTKELGKGTGLGLSTVLNIMEQHRGWIEVESQVGEGATFNLYLPRSAENKSASVPAAEEPPVPRGTETILLVEDEETVRRSIAHTLARYGYRVRAANSGAAGLEIWRQHHESIQLIVTDVVMPGGVSGRALFDQMRSEKPDLKVIFCSGYTDEILGNDALLRGNPNFIEKPFAPEKLVRKIRACLDGAEEELP